jgi:hypothetical protein
MKHLVQEIIQLSQVKERRKDTENEHDRDFFQWIDRFAAGPERSLGRARSQ